MWQYWFWASYISAGLLTAGVFIGMVVRSIRKGKCGPSVDVAFEFKMALGEAVLGGAFWPVVWVFGLGSVVVNALTRRVIR